MAAESLKNKTISGIGWSAADALLGQGVTFIVGIILARILSPDEYGLIGICLIFNVILNGIVDSGFSNALIRKKDCTNDDYNTMFIINFFVSIILYFILFFSSQFIAAFFGRYELTLLLQVSGTIIIFNALSLTHTTILTKLIDFKTKTKASLVSSILSGVLGIVMAFFGFGPWSLVGQIVSRQLLYTLCLWFFVRWWPTLKFSPDSFYYMWGFGWKMLLSGLLNNIWNQLYQVVVGKYYSPATLGQYTRSRQFAGIFSENLTIIIQRVSYPILSNIQDNQERMLTAYRKLIKVTMFVTVLCMFGLAGIAEPFIYCLIGPQWHEAATYLPLICISMSLYPLHAINLNMLQVLGRSDIFLYLEIIKKVLAVIPIALGIFISVYWMLIASIVIGILSFFINSWYTGKKLGYSSWKQLLDVAPSYSVGTLIAISVYFLKYLPISNMLILILQIIIGISVMFALCETINLYEFSEIKLMVSKIFIKLKRL